MPVERTQRSLKQSTLFNFAKPLPSTTVATAKRSPAIPSHKDDDSDLEPDARTIGDTVENPSLPSPKRRHPKRKPKSVPKAKPNPKAKAGDEDRSLEDVVLSIKPEFTKLISERKKNHEYRKYKLKESVKHLWLYETAPTSAITYVMSTTKPKVPGEVNDPTGIGNDDFDNGLKQSKYGYPVTELYKLKKPLTTAQLKQRFDIAVPQGWRYATRKLVEELPLADMERVF